MVRFLLLRIERSSVLLATLLRLHPAFTSRVRARGCIAVEDSAFGIPINGGVI